MFECKSARDDGEPLRRAGGARHEVGQDPADGRHELEAVAREAGAHDERAYPVEDEVGGRRQRQHILQLILIAVVVDARELCASAQHSAVNQEASGVLFQ